MTDMNDLRICFVGDSYMNGSGDLELLGWVRRLCRKRYTAHRRFTFYELGVRGATSADVKSGSPNAGFDCPKAPTIAWCFNSG
ncbi:MAG: hypothetical protein P8J45_05555 [Phycisphaerales bacterium]|jgi:hypothetical protein|nr:hypothetical protein [Phycisphaerales bacterium]